MRVCVSVVSVEITSAAAVPNAVVIVSECYGESVAERLQRGGQLQAGSVLRQMAGGLAHLHDRRVVVGNVEVSGCG